MHAHSTSIFPAPSPSSSPSSHGRRRRQRQRQQLSAVVKCSASSSSSVPFSISDSDLTSRGFNLHRTASNLDPDALNAVFSRVGFPRREPARIRLALEHTQAVVWVEDGRSGAPVAFARATGDGVFNAVVWDVVVDPSFQGMGLGKAVVERLLSDLLATGVTNIGLYSEPRVVGFYRPLGFAADPDGIKAMVYSRKKNKKR
ncbi:putative uncharacterized N-acetyltransferase ycf52 [Iris pallida]|uniref:Uncharacterized N-acetyltransferase ycf52 n=1 Tax=Iris pallida TaxID=29817 RepID=A0AAX6EFH1_IRIPA|nr:putative uncharacterized N-acetyltransferase ycf52 [Iris pallida]